MRPFCFVFLVSGLAACAHPHAFPGPDLEGSRPPSDGTPPYFCPVPGQGFLNPEPASVDRYRFTWLRSFDPVAVVRFEREGEVVYADGTECYGKGDSEVAGIKKRSTRSVSPMVWRDWVDALQTSSSWRATLAGHPPEPSVGMDGATWVLEHRHGHDYEVVTLWSTDVQADSAFQQATLHLLELAGLKQSGDVY